MFLFVFRGADTYIILADFFAVEKNKKISKYLLTNNIICDIVLYIA